MNDIQKRILEAVAIKEGGISRSEICKLTLIPRTTVYDNLVKLEKAKIVEKYTVSNGLRGRSVVYWRFRNYNG